MFKYVFVACIRGNIPEKVRFVIKSTEFSMKFRSVDYLGRRVIQ